MAPWTPWPGCETVEYRNPAGDAVRFLMLAGATGRIMPPVKLTTLPVPAMNGSRYLGAAHLERMVAIPVAVPGSITSRDELRRWAQVLDPTKGQGTLTVVEGANAGRVLTCAYDAGLDELEETFPDVNLGTILFRAAWPYWADGVESSVEVRQGSTLTTWFPFLPLVLGASDAFASFTITNTGDVRAWPVVTVLGPGQVVTAENLTTGLSWTVTGSIAAGSTLVVDTRPGSKRVTIDGVNSFPRLTADSALWPLEPGPNRVSLSMAFTSAASLASFAWRNLWLSA